MSIIVTVEFQAQPDQAETLQGAIKGALPDTRAYDGCEYATATVNMDDPTNIIIVEGWASRGAYEKYFAWRVESGLLDALGPLVAAPPVIKYLDKFDG